MTRRYQVDLCYAYQVAPLVFAAICAVAGGALLAFFIRVGFNQRRGACQ